MIYFLPLSLSRFHNDVEAIDCTVFGVLVIINTVYMAVHRFMVTDNLSSTAIYIFFLPQLMRCKSSSDVLCVFFMYESSTTLLKA